MCFPPLCCLPSAAFVQNLKVRPFLIRLLAFSFVAHVSNLLLALDAKQVFDAVAPSTVLIEDVDGFGSGVFLNDKGLILTNYHVVAANIALRNR